MFGDQHYKLRIYARTPIESLLLIILARTGGISWERGRSLSENIQYLLVFKMCEE